MGFQSSFNQLLATASAGALGAKHLAHQKEANVSEAYRTASALTEEKGSLAQAKIGLEQEGKMLETKTAESEVGLGLARTKYKDYLSNNPNMSKGQKAYASRLSKEMLNAKSAYEDYSNKLQGNLVQQIALKERINILRGKEENASKRVKEILGKVGSK